MPSARRLPAVLSASPVSARSSKAGVAKVAHRVDGPVFPERSQDFEVSRPSETRLHSSGTRSLETVQVGCDRPIRKIRVLGTEPRLELRKGQVPEGRRREGGQARLPGGVRVGQLDDPAIDAHDAPGDVGVAPGELEDHVSTPRLAGQDRPTEPECLDEGSSGPGRRCRFRTRPGARPSGRGRADRGRRPCGHGRADARPPRPTGAHWRQDHGRARRGQRLDRHGAAPHARSHPAPPPPAPRSAPLALDSSVARSLVERSSAERSRRHGDARSSY